MKLYHNDDELLVCELTETDVTNAEAEFDLYMSKQGATYEQDWYKEPSVRQFFKLYFGEVDYDIYCGDIYTVPCRYILTSETDAARFMALARQLQYHDTFAQKYCDVERNGNMVDVYYGDY